MVNRDALAAFIEASTIQKYRPTSRSFIFDCPVCGHDKKLFIFKHNGAYVCWVCADTNRTKGKRPEFILAPLSGMSVKDVAERIYDEPPSDMGSPFAVDWDDEDEAVYLEEMPIVDAAPAYWPYDYYEIDSPSGAAGAEYLAGRGIPLDVAKRYGIRYSPRKLSISFPAEFDGILYGYQDRLVIPHEWWDEEEQKMVKVPKSPSMKAQDLRGWRDRILMFMDRLKGSDHAVLCEGPIDAIKADLCGGNVAAMGKSIGSKQIDILRRLGVRKLYLALDPDAFEQTSRLVRDLYGEFEIYNMILGEGEAEDLGAMSFEAVLDFFRRAPRENGAAPFISFA